MAVSYKYQKFNAQTREFCKSQASDSEEGKSRSHLKSFDKIEKVIVIVKTIDAGYKNKIEFEEGFPLSRFSRMRGTGST